MVASWTPGVLQPPDNPEEVQLGLQINIAAIVASVLLGSLSTACAEPDAGADYLQRLPEDEVVYFVLPDRFENADPSNDTGGIEGDRLAHGFDPTHKGFYHGGDLKGLTSRLDYIQDMGATAIWLGPIYKNKAVQGDPGSESSGYHGYWITDFTTVDPHLGTEADLKEFVDEAHERGIKIYLDIVTNHTADVIAYRECHDPDFVGQKLPYGACPYISKAEYPFTTRGAADGPAINDGFMGDTAPYQTAENFAKLTRADSAYTPYVPDAEKDIKVPAWLNDPIYYHNRGDSTFEGESTTHGDFSGLDDIQTEDPRVVEGFIDIFKGWITKYKMDGFRVDTARHVNSEFWQAFIPAMLDHAKAEGIPNFYIFGEAAWHDPAMLIQTTYRDAYPAVLDFPLADKIKEVFVGKQSTHLLADLYSVDSLYNGGTQTARRLPVFNGSHDDGRFAGEVLRGVEGASDDELFRRVNLAYATLFFARGVPIIYYGDEQGFTGDGRDQASREDMFESRVASYNDNKLIASEATTAESNFDPEHPLYRSFQNMARIVHDHPALRRGEQVHRLSESGDAGLFVISRIDASSGQEYLFAMNTGTSAREFQVEIDPSSKTWSSVHGACQSKATATSSYKVSLEALDFIICRSGREE